MVSLRKLIREVTPPIVIKLIEKEKHNGMWSGNFASWQKAIEKCSGYDDEVIVEKCKSALLEIKNGRAVYERDSVLFDQKQYSWPLLAALQNAALVDARLSVLDFGGSLGSTYYQNREFLGPVEKLQWTIVEQRNFVDCGREHFADDRLKFHDTIEECRERYLPNVLLLSSVLQYLETPMDWIKKFLALRIKTIIIDRAALIAAPKRLTVQNVSEDIYTASYPCWFFNEQEFLGAFLTDYELLADFSSFADPDRTSEDGKRMYWKGFILKRKA